MFGKRKEEMMVYVVMGFLEAGKTSLVRDLIVDDMFDDKIKTLILACEEGEEDMRRLTLRKAVLSASILRTRSLSTEKLSRNS